jgi:hypothetical protein
LTDDDRVALSDWRPARSKKIFESPCTGLSVRREGAVEMYSSGQKHSWEWAQEKGEQYGQDEVMGPSTLFDLKLWGGCQGGVW